MTEINAEFILHAAILDAGLCIFPVRSTIHFHVHSCPQTSSLDCKWNAPQLLPVSQCVRSQPLTAAPVFPVHSLQRSTSLIHRLLTLKACEPHRPVAFRRSKHPLDYSLLNEPHPHWYCFKWFPSSVLEHTVLHVFQSLDDLFLCGFMLEYTNSESSEDRTVRPEQ